MTRRTNYESARRAAILVALLALSVWSGATETPPPPASDTLAPAPGTSGGAGTAGTEKPALIDEHGVNRLVEQLRNSETRRAARDALASTGPEAVDGLLPFLRDPDMTVRWEVATILGTIGDQKAAPALVLRVIEDDNPHVRWRSLWSLSRFKEARDTTVADLRMYLDSERESDRWNAAVGLSMFDEPDGVPLFHAGVSHFKPWRRWEAINALGRVHDRATVQVLAGVLSSDRPRDRQEAVLSLGKIGGDEAVQVLIEALGDPQEDVRWRACLALGRVADPIARESLEGLIESGDEARVLKHARDALARVNQNAG
jgi:HEAT repeat protein